MQFTFSSIFLQLWILIFLIVKIKIENMYMHYRTDKKSN